MPILNVHAVICIHAIVIPGVIDGNTPTTSTITEVYTHGAVDYYTMSTKVKSKKTILESPV